MTQGIYEISINGMKYIGKDSDINISRRYKQHMCSLKANKHYNKHLQRAFNKYGEVEYNVLMEFSDIDAATLNKVEMFYIDLFDTMNNGFNQTIGGDGVKGRKASKEETARMIKTKLDGFSKGIYIKTIGETNGMSKLTEQKVKEIVLEFYKGKKSHTDIAMEWNVDRATIGSIYTGVRWGYLEEVQKWLLFKKENKHKLRKQGMNTLLPSDAYEIKHLLLFGFGDAELASLYKSSVMTVCRIRNNKGYQEIDTNKSYSYYKL